MIALGLGLAALPAAAAHAQGIGMPAGARQWIKVNGNYVDDGICCDDAVGGVGSIPYPSPNYVRSPTFLAQGCFIYSNADSNANRLRNSYARYRTDSVFNYNSLVDTYTISGPPGSAGTPVDAHLVYRVVGTLFVGPNPFGSGLIYVGGSNVAIEVGTWAGATDPTFNEQFRVNAFNNDNTNFRRFAQLPTANYGSSQPALPVDMAVDQVLPRIVGQPFDVAFGLETIGYGAGDLGASPAPGDNDYVVATIDWQLPAGYTISSVLGWTNGCPADANGDGAVTPADVGVFVATWFASLSNGTLEGDFDHDGAVTSADIGAFVTAWFQAVSGGC